MAWRITMTIKEIQARAGSLSDYLGYIFLMWGWYFLDNLYTSIQPVSPGSWLEPLLNWAIRIVIYPILLAGIFGGIHEQQQTQENWDLSGFLIGIKKHYLRMIGANLLVTIFILVVSIIILASGIVKRPDFGDNRPLLALITIPYSAISLFWFATITIQRKLFPALFQAVKTVVLNPYALLIGIIWGTLGFADTFFFDYLTTPIHPVVNGLRAAVLAVARILAIVYALAVYQQAYGESPRESAEETSLAGDSSTSSGDGLANAGFGFALVSCLPVLHLVALVLGVIAVLRKKRSSIRSAIACSFGGFFTIFYVLLLAGWLISGAAPSQAPKYTFLSEVSPGLRPQTLLLEQGSFREVQQQLEQQTTSSANSSWASDCALALARFHNYDTKGALEAFWTAAEKKPERSEFYYYYGIALLENNQEERAAEQFRLALTHEPKLEQAERYLNLINSAYTPSRLISSVLFVIILLVLFAFHEYGHALVAWKLGDNTAEQQGRLTLNPLRHLDLFGSIILPAILLFQQSGMVFGWAKPVPVDPRNFKDPQRDHMRVAFAGPAVNLLVSMVCFVMLGCILFFVRLFWPETISLNFSAPSAPVSIVGPAFARWLVVIVAFIKQLFYTSLILGCLNLIPVPPLDGSWILSGLLPQRLSQLLEKTRGYAFLIFLLLVMTPVLDYVLSIPISLAWGVLELLVSAMRFG
jgi:Zn-dependent protease